MIKSTHVPMLIACLLLAASSQPVRGEEATILCVGPVGKTRQQAERWLKQLEKEKGVLAQVLSLPAGYPRILTHAEVPELKPDENVVALGICPTSQASAPLSVAEAFTFDAWRKKLPTAPTAFACPGVIGGGRVARGVFDVKQDAALSAIVVPAADAGKGGRVFLVARGPGEELLSWKSVAFPAGCSAQLSSDKDGIHVEKTCQAPAPASKETLRFAVVNGKIGPAAGLEQLADVQAMVWSVGTPAGAKEALARWERVKAGLPPELLRLAPGYPRIVRSDDVGGLEPGKHVVLLGLCPADRLGGAVKTLQTLEPGVFAQKVTVAGGEPACPEESIFTVQQVERVQAGALQLTVVRNAKDDDRGYPWLLTAFLRDASGKLLAWRKDDTNSLAAQGGTCLDLETLAPESSKAGGAGPDRVRARVSCTVMRTDQGSPYAVEVVYTVRGGTIAAQVTAEEPIDPR